MRKDNYVLFVIIETNRLLKVRKTKLPKNQLHKVIALLKHLKPFYW